MENEYLSYVEREKKLLEVVGPILPKLQSLSREQVETLVFYLKSLHGYYPLSEPSVSNSDTFSGKLQRLRESPEQVTLQKQAAMLMFKAMGMAMLVGVMAAGGLLAMVSGATIGAGVLLGAVGLFVVAESRYGKRALEAAKEQDRRYFLESLRAAKGCNELDWAGLFAFNGVTQPGPQSDEAIAATEKRIADLCSQLRDALYNDEYMSYSRKG